MIWESRKWRLVSRVLAMVVASVLMLALAGPASYALQDDTPKHITLARQLYDEKGAPVTDRFIYVEATPRLDEAVSVGEGAGTRYMIPIEGFGSDLFIYAEDGIYLFPFDYTPEQGFVENRSPLRYSGKVTTLKSQPNADEALERLQMLGIEVDKETAMVLRQGEEPSDYRPFVPVVPALALLWAVAMIGAWQVWRGRRPRRRPAFQV